MNNSPINEFVGLPAIEDCDERWRSIEENLRGDQSIPFCCLGIKDVVTAFGEACRLAVNHLPPFEEKSDKGFKDFVIGWTVMELVEEKPGARVVVLTNVSVGLNQPSSVGPKQPIR